MELDPETSKANQKKLGERKLNSKFRLMVFSFSDVEL
jgi:hypothetical protein